MRTLMIAAALSVVGVAAPSAQTPAASPAAPLGPPRAYQGYAQPDIGANYCRAVNSGLTSCTLPGMTAGRYLVKASGTSTAQGPGAAQKLVIVVGNRNCGAAERSPSAKQPWTSGAKTIRLNCEILVLTDRPLAVSAVYGDVKATRAASGPTLTLERLPWEGVLSATVAPTEQMP